MQVDITHFASDTYPRVIADPTGSPNPELLVPFRVRTAEPDARVVSSRLDVEVDGRSWSTRARVRQIHPGFADWLREQMQRQSTFGFDHLPYYLEMDPAREFGRAQYLEARLPQVPAGATVRYHLELTVRSTDGVDQEARSARFTTWAIPPTFTREDIKRIHIPGPGGAMDAWVLYHRRRGGSDEFRIDVVDLQVNNGSLGMVVQVGDRVLDLNRPDPDALPLLDVSADSITFAVPHEGGGSPPVSVSYRHGQAVPVDLDRRTGVGSARLMFVNFAIQGLNDLFATADDDYTPPRTYAQVTMRDPAASFSSRPGSKETTTGDGYGYTLDAHRRYRVPQMWAMNGGLLGLLAHDCPDELERMRADLRDKLLVPVVTGFGAHRVPYYSAATNSDSIRFGSEALVEILGATRPVYYPDSRITTCEANVVEALRRNDMQYLVVDAGAGETNNSDFTVVQNPQPAMGATTGDRYHNWQYLWRDRKSGLKIVFIDPEMKDKLLRGPTDEVLRDADRGKVALELRRKFIELAAQPTLRERNLLVYSDDADKASGNGWFDGVYGTGKALPFNHQYQAALSWLAAHPWVQVITTDDLADDDVVGELDLIRASDPYIKKWTLPFDPVPGQRFELAFDTWYAAWSAVRPAWLGETLKEISDRAEQFVEQWPAEHRNGLYDLAALYVTICLHESQWSKRARIDEPKPGYTDPENFVVAESIQLRNAHVYLNASVWASWARQPPVAGEPEGYRDNGPVVEKVAELDAGPATWRLPDAAGLQWDHDPLANVVLYNRDALVVIDRNGGRITHLFAMVDGLPVSVSGTFKAYQFLDMDWPSDSGTECEGIVLQNTVWTPNHAYVACDVDPSRCTTGASPDGDEVFDFYYPDNFNAYEVADAPAGQTGVRLTYGEGQPLEEAPETLADLDSRLAEDRRDKLEGRDGVVLHDTGAFGRFSKTIRLDGRTVHVSYEDTEPGHRIANEFCVDLWAAAMKGQRQSHRVARDGRSADVMHVEGKLGVRIELGSRCEFSAATSAPVDARTAESLRVHRVMTDDLEIVAPAGGDFDYRIVLP